MVKNHKYVSGYIATHIHQYLSLYSVNLGVPRSKSLKQAIQKWYIERIEKESFEDLIQAQIKAFQKEWEDSKVKLLSGKENTPMTGLRDKFNEFLLRKKSTLRQANIEKETIDIILTKLHL